VNAGNKARPFYWNRNWWIQHYYN